MAFAPRERYVEPDGSRVLFCDRAANLSYLNPGAGGPHARPSFAELGYVVTQPTPTALWPSAALEQAARHACARTELTDAAQQALAALEQRFGVRILLLGGLGAEDFVDYNSGGVIWAQGEAGASYSEYVQSALAPELGLYPPSMLRDVVGLRVLVLTGAMTYNGQARTALPSYEHHALYVDAAPTHLGVVRDATDRRKVLHHELFHLIDYADLGDGHFEDVCWAALSGMHVLPIAAADQGGETMRGDRDGIWAVDPTEPHFLPGYVTAYASAAIIEDKAECFAALMYFRAESLAPLESADRRVAVKLAEMRRRVALLCPDWSWEAIDAYRRQRFAEEGASWQRHVKDGLPFYHNPVRGQTSWNPHS